MGTGFINDFSGKIWSKYILAKALNIIKYINILLMRNILYFYIISNLTPYEQVVFCLKILKRDPAF